MVFQYRIPKRFTDLNVGGHVDHGALIDYLQEARTELLLAAPEPMRAMLGSGVLVTGHQVAYLAPIGFEQPAVDAEVWIDAVGGARFSISYRISDGGVPVAQARTFLVPYDLAAQKLRRLATAERDQLAAAVAEPVPIEPLGRLKAGACAGAYEVPVRTRWADLDSYRHVNNVKFFDYLAQARIQLLAGGGPLDPTEAWMVVQQDLDYWQPIDFRREPYAVRTAVTKIGQTSCSFAAEIVDPLDGRCFATARTVMVRVDRAGVPRPITGVVRERLEAARLTAEPG